MKHTARLILFLPFICVVAAAPGGTSDYSSLGLSKLRYSDRGDTNLRFGDNNNLNATIRRRGGRGGRGGGRPASGGAAAGTSSDTGGGPACFPGSAYVNVFGKGVIKMSEVEIGDKVETRHDFSAVYMFSHRITRGEFEFVRILTDSGDITVSGGHYVFAGGRLVTAESVKIGDELEKANGDVAKIIRKEIVEEVGLYNPHTLSGEMIVNGMRVSVYTKSVNPIFAKCVLSPMRGAFRMVGLDITGGALSSNISDRVIRALPKGYDK